MDLFEPVSQPPKDYYRMPLDTKVEFIGDGKQIKKLECLIGQKYIGVDSEWRPQMHRWQETKGPAILQIAGKHDAFMIDMIGLAKNRQLDQVLSKIFSNKDTLVMGFGFASDLDQFRKYLPNMKFYQYIANFIDLQNLYKKKRPNFKDEGGFNLAVVCEKTISKKLCKGEQMSNWENRPLRYSQEHYACLDAYVLPLVFIKLVSQENYRKDGDVKSTITTIGTEPAGAPKDRENRNDSTKKNSGNNKEENKETKRGNSSYKNNGDAKYSGERPTRERKPKNTHKDDNLEVPKNQTADPESIAHYDSKIEYHKKMVTHF